MPADPIDATADAPVAARRGLGAIAAPVLVFGTSAAVLVLEVLAGRLVAPYVGVSLETYTGIIGTVLAGIAIGTAVGGRLADRHDPRRLLGPLLVAAGLASILALPIINVLGPRAGGRGGAGGIVLLAVGAFVLPTALLSAVSPMAAKLRLRSTEETGTVVGGLSAWGTAGALVGTFLTGFVFVAALPTRPIVVAVGVALVAVGAALLRPRRNALLAATGLFLVGSVASSTTSPCQRETRYACASVLADPQRPSGRLLVLDDLQHSYVDLADPAHLQFRYVRQLAQATGATLGPGRLDALFIGGGGFTLPRWLTATRPGSTATVLELDPEVVRLAEDRLGLRTGPDLRVRTGDARLTIARQPGASVDLVVGDAFGSRSVPWHLATVELVEEVARVLRPGGTYAMNVIDGGDQRLVRAELATLRRVFPHVAVVLPPDGRTGNHVLVASRQPLDPASLATSDGRALAGAELDRFVGGAEALRDDFAPADQLIARR